jgi:hypothetical protein
MARASRIWLGIFTFLPLVLIMAYLIAFGFLVKDVLIYDRLSVPVFTSMFWLFLVMLVLGIFSFGLLIYYIIHVMNSKADSNEKLIWVLLFFVGSIMAFPVYWYFKIWKQPTENLMSAF